MVSQHTTRTKTSLIKRLTEEFGEDVVPFLTARDYEEVRERLGWKKSSYKTALRYLGQPTDGLEDGSRDYEATDEDLEIMRGILGAPFVNTMAFTGARLSEMWQMVVTERSLIRYTVKGSITVIRSLDGVPPDIRMDIQRWVLVESKKLKMDAVQKRLERAVKRGILNPECTPHALRHRAASIMHESGESIEAVAEWLGHRYLQSTRRYLHKKTNAKLARLLVPGKAEQ